MDVKLKRGWWVLPLVAAIFLLVVYLIYVYVSGRSFGPLELVVGAAVVILFVLLQSLMGSARGD